MPVEESREADESPELAAVRWLLKRGATTSNAYLASLYRQAKAWFEDDDPEFPDPLSHKQLQQLVKNHQQWLNCRRIKEEVRRTFRGEE